MRMPVGSRARDLVLAAMLVFPAMLGACKPQAGGSCKVDGKEACVDEKKGFACHDGKWEEMTCRGPAGCAKNGGDAVCDQTTAESGDVCNRNDDFVCSGDKKAMLQCSKNKWTVSETCLGERGCVLEKSTVNCDNSIANVGDGCRDPKDHACSSDKKFALACRDGKFAQASPCKGPEQCSVVGTKEAGFKIRCDDSIASVGDACEKEDTFSCSADERSILKCRNKKFDHEEKCRSKEKCQVRSGQVGCY